MTEAFVFNDHTSNLGGPVGINGGNMVGHYIAAYRRTTSQNPPVIVSGISVEFPNDATLVQMRDAIVAAIVARGAEYGFTDLQRLIIPQVSIIPIV